MPNFIPVEGERDRKRIFFVYSSDMLKMLEQPNKGHTNIHLDRLLKRVSEEDNPVIFSYIVK